MGKLYVKRCLSTYFIYKIPYIERYSENFNKGRPENGGKQSFDEIMWHSTRRISNKRPQFLDEESIRKMLFESVHEGLKNQNQGVDIRKAMQNKSAVRIASGINSNNGKNLLNNPNARNFTDSGGGTKPMKQSGTAYRVQPVVEQINKSAPVVKHSSRLKRKLKDDEGRESVNAHAEKVQGIEKNCNPPSSGDSTAVALPPIPNDICVVAKEEEEPLRRNKMKPLSLAAFGAVFASLTLALIEYSRRSDVDVDSDPKPASKKLFYEDIRSSATKFFGMSEKPRKLLAEPPGSKYTLVIEPKGILVDFDLSDKGNRIYKFHPYTEAFLKDVREFGFEIVFFTSEPGNFCVMQNSDENVNYCLFRESMRCIDGNYVKDLSDLNRDICKIVVVDTDGLCTMKQPHNELILPKWDGVEDKSLKDLSDFLKMVSISQVADVRTVLEHYKKFGNPVQAYKESKKMMESKITPEPRGMLPRLTTKYRQCL